jgi:hypothetical protein
LLQEAQTIEPVPKLNYLVALEALNGDAFKLYLSSSGKTKPPCLSLVGAARGVADYHLVSLGYHILDGDVEVGEGLEGPGEPLLDFL